MLQSPQATIQTMTIEEVHAAYAVMMDSSLQDELMKTEDHPDA